jgi:MFS family permease
VIVATLGTVLAIAVGISFYGVSVYLEAPTHGPDGFPLATASAATGAFLFVAGIAGVGVGVAALLARLDARWVISVGADLAAAALLVLGHARSPAQLLLAYSCLGAGFAATSTIPASTVITRWFPRRRALALSLVFTGLPIGGALLTPPIAALVRSLGVAGAAPWLAGTYVVGVVPVTVAFLRPAPRPQGDGPGGAVVPAGEEAGATARHAVRTGWFWAATTALMLACTAAFGLTVGNMQVLHPLLIAERSGARDYAGSWRYPTSG